MTADRHPSRVALTSLGCKVNYAEMAELAGTLAAAGLEVVGDGDGADIHVLNSCTVTLAADASSRQRLARLRRDNPSAHLIITGCSVAANPDQYVGAGAVADAVFDNRNKSAIADHILALVGSVSIAVPTSPPRRSRAFIKVQDGCNHRCTYCIVWSARGQSRSLPPAAVANAVAAAIDDGHQEIVLTGVDLGSYGRDMGTRLAALVTATLAQIEGRARLRLSSINANDIGDDLIHLAGHPALCHHWHMPLQSGSDRVLRAMHRGYRRAAYLRIAGALRAQAPDTELTTDIMVGFPGEDDSDHRATLELVAEARLLEGHVFRWSPRPGTPAVTLEDQVSAAVGRRRSAEVIAACARSRARQMEAAVGRDLEVVWDRVDQAQAHGLSGQYHPVLAAAGPATVRGRRSPVHVDAVGDGVLRVTMPRS